MYTLITNYWVECIILSIFHSQRTYSYVDPQLWDVHNCDSYIYEQAITGFDSRYDIRILTVDYEYNVKPRLDYAAAFRVDVNTFECQIQVYDYFNMG